MSVERDRYRRHVPFCETRIALVDQYSFPEKDTSERICMNGLSHPIYSADGKISRQLPLDMYPRVDEVHPEMFGSSNPHFGMRNINSARQLEQRQLQRAGQRLNGDVYVNDDSGYYDAYANAKKQYYGINANFI